MQIESSATFSRQFYSQTDMGLDIRLENVGDLSINFTNNTGNLTGFNLSSGKIFAPGNKFISTFDYSKPLDFRVDVESNLYSAWINDSLVAASQTLYTGAYSYITGVRIANNWSEAQNLSLIFRGQSPSLEFGELRTDNLEHFTGYVKSNALPINLTGVIPQTLSLVSFPTGQFTSGNYVLSGNNLYSGNTENINFQFNFGAVQTGIQVYYTDPTIPTGFLNVTFGPVIQDYLDRSGIITPVQYQDVSVVSSWAFPTNLQYELDYIGRSGEGYVTGTGYSSGYYSGYLNGSGYVYSNQLTGIISGILYPPSASSLFFTGVGSGSFYTFTTGQISYEYIINASGYESGQLATGVIYGELTGIVNPGSGRYLFNQSVTGTPSVSVWDGGMFLSPTGVYTGNVNHLSILSKYVTVYGSGNFTGIALNEDYSGSITAFNLITATIGELYNADYQSGYYNFYNFKERNLYSPQPNPVALIDLDPISVNPGLFMTGIRISYEQYDFGNLTDHARFVIMNEYTGMSSPILGNTL